jgi:hypothetical protein
MSTEISLERSLHQLSIGAIKHGASVVNDTIKNFKGLK